MMTPAEFINAFGAAFRAQREHLLWDKENRRTGNMVAYIYRTIADQFPGIWVDYEYPRGDNKGHIDAVLYNEPILRGEINYSSIEVAIEHENDPGGIRKELIGFSNHRFPLNVLITYPPMPTNEAERKAAWVITNHGHLLKQIQRELLFIFQGQDLSNHAWGEPIHWKYFRYADGTLQQLEASPPQ